MKASSDKLYGTPYESAPSLRVGATRSGSATVVTVAGEIDMYSARELELALTGHVSSGAGVVVVDLDGVSFLGSVGLAVLHQAAVGAADQGVALHLAVTTKVVTRALDVSGLTQEFSLHRSVQEAVAHGDRGRAPLPVSERRS
ncbi:STAS domain-containing protein [Allokutzneria oryzae]|uniref:Anti-sigma factor antagonist n=1 Tax=Allokutzneria oryzae TaxID=1378989 RepID=A0ABV5ZTA4_9PSEU